mgnify:CR=1 FL=1
MEQSKNTDTVILESKYVDPSNSSEILEKLTQSATMGDVSTLIKTTFPDWVVTHLPGFSTDYPHLTKNWQQHCDQIGVKRCDVVIVEYLDLEKADSNHTLVSRFADCLTMCGFAVRLKENYIPCEKTGLAVPTLAMWETMKKMKVVVPEKWSPTVTENSVSVTK